MVGNKRFSVRGRWMILAALAVQILLLFLLGVDAGQSRNVRGIIAVCTGIVIIAAETIYMFRGILREIDSACLEEKQRLLEYRENYRKLRQMNTVQREEESRQIKKELIEKIQNMENILHSGLSENLEEQFCGFADDLKTVFKRTRQPVWCENTLVNILIEDKMTTAREYGISFEAALEVPKECVVSPLDLCGVFGNLLDNALEGAARTGGKSWLSVKAAVISGFLVVRVTNSYKKDEKKTGHNRIFRKGKGEVYGIGLTIVEKITGKYGGSLMTEESDGVFSAVAYMECKKKGEET